MLSEYSRGECGYKNLAAKYGLKRDTVRCWILDNRLRRKSTRTLKYSEEEQKKAIDYYLTHGKCITKIVKDLGYPSKGLLALWISINLQESNIGRTKIKSSIYLSSKIKQKAVTEFMAQNKTVATVSAEYGVRTVTLYNWKREIFGDKKIQPMRKKKNTVVHDLVAANKELKIQLDKMQEEYEELQKQTYRMRLEYDVLEAASKIFKASNGTYGDHRIYTELKNNSIRLSEKVVRNLMKEENLSVKFIKRNISYIGEITPAIINLLKRDFHADLSNKK